MPNQTGFFSAAQCLFLQLGTFQTPNSSFQDCTFMRESASTSELLINTSPLKISNALWECVCSLECVMMDPHVCCVQGSGVRCLSVRCVCF